MVTKGVTYPKGLFEVQGVEIQYTYINASFKGGIYFSTINWMILVKAFFGFSCFTKNAHCLLCLCTCTCLHLTPHGVISQLNFLISYLKSQVLEFHSYSRILACGDLNRITPRCNWRDQACDLPWLGDVASLLQFTCLARKRSNVILLCDAQQFTIEPEMGDTK